MPVKIGNKEYKTVAERLVEFHEEYKGQAINIMTEILQSDRVNHVRMKCVIEVSEPLRVFTGHAEEDYDGNYINKTSALEVCETSCIGRALATAGKIGEELASADEVANAIQNQGQHKLLSPDAVEKAKANVQSGEHFSYKKSLMDMDWSLANREKPIRFGKHKGTQWSEVTDNYVNWLAENSDNKDVKQFAQDEMLHRTPKGEPDSVPDSAPDNEPKTIKSSLQSLADKVAQQGIAKSEKADNNVEELVNAIHENDRKAGERAKKDTESLNDNETLPF